MAMIAYCTQSYVTLHRHIYSLSCLTKTKNNHRIYPLVILSHFHAFLCCKIAKPCIIAISTLHKASNQTKGLCLKLLNSCPPPFIYLYYFLLRVQGNYVMRENKAGNGFQVTNPMTL